MGEGPGRVAGILERLAEREVEVEAVGVGQITGRQRGLHRADIVCGKLHGLQVGKAPPDFAEGRGNRQRLPVGGDPVGLPPDGFQHMAIAHPDLGLARRGLQHLLVKRNRLVEPADPAKGCGLQVGMGDILRFNRPDQIELGNRLRWPVLTVERCCQIGAGRPEIRGQFQRPAQQGLGILVAANPTGKLRQHPDSGGIERIIAQMGLQQRLGLRQAVVVQRQRRLHQARVAQRGCHGAPTNFGTAFLLRHDPPRPCRRQ